MGIAHLPLKNIQLTSGFGYRVHPVTGAHDFHSGIDLRARHDTVYAILPGKVVATSFDALLGFSIRIDHQFCTGIYGHLSLLFVQSGEQVISGQPIAITGATGRVTGEHLHFSVRAGKHYINPLAWLHALLVGSAYPSRTKNINR